MQKDVSDRTAELAWFEKGISLGYLKRYEEAIECYDKAIQINPNDDSGWGGKGVALRELERYEEAIECFDKAIPLAVESYEKTMEGFKNVISLLEYLVSRSGLSKEEVIEQMRKNGFEPFHIASGRNMGKIGFRKKRVQ